MTLSDLMGRPFACATQKTWTSWRFKWSLEQPSSSALSWWRHSKHYHCRLPLVSFAPRRGFFGTHHPLRSLVLTSTLCLILRIRVFKALSLDLRNLLCKSVSYFILRLCYFQDQSLLYLFLLLTSSGSGYQTVARPSSAYFCCLNSSWLTMKSSQSRSTCCSSYLESSASSPLLQST